MRAAGFETQTFAGSGHSPAALLHLRLGFQERPVDVLHANDPHALTAAGLASRGIRIPVRIAARRVAFKPRTPLAYRWLADHVICVSGAARRRCLDAGIPEGRISVVYDGVDPNRIVTASRARGRRILELAPETPALLSVAALEECKGHRTLIEAFVSVLAAFPRARLVLAGAGSRQTALRALARRRGVDSQLDWLGHRSDVPDLIAAADVLVLASTTEGLGSSLIEAMLAARAIVATRVGGVPELLGTRPLEPELAWLVPPNDPQAIAQAIISALRDPLEAAARGRRARARARHSFLAARMVKETLEVYQQVLAMNRRPPQRARARSLSES